MHEAHLHRVMPPAHGVLLLQVNHIALPPDMLLASASSTVFSSAVHCYCRCLARCQLRRPLNCLQTCGPA